MLKKITKKLAIKMYNENYNITIVASKCRPDGFLAIHTCIEKREDFYTNFEKVCNEYRYYNCSYETGRTVAFYVERTDYDEFTGKK